MPAWGAPDQATGGTGPATRLGVRAKHPTANSSTTRGPQGLAGEPGRRRCRTAKGGRRGVGEALLTSAPRNRGTSRGNYARAGARDIRRRPRGVTPSSDVTGRAEATANLGGAAAAGAVPRC